MGEISVRNQRAQRRISVSGLPEENAGFDGMATTEKRLKTIETEDECILGYSQVVIKSQVQPSHQRTFAFVVFDSTNPKWDIDWCNSPEHGHNFCYENLMKLRDKNRQ